VFDDAGDSKEFVKLFIQYGYISFTRSDEGTDLPAGPWTTRNFDPGNVDTDKKTFYDQVNLHLAAELNHNTLLPEGFTNLIQGKKDNTFFFCNETGNDKIDRPYLVRLLFDRLDPK
jgi:hypothetical protein